jgi:phosphohistidine phosphatase
MAVMAEQGDAPVDTLIPKGCRVEELRMITITLFRHAKTEQPEPGGSDFDRELTGRGEKDAAAMGAYLVAENIRPDLILCSTSMRTRQTLELAFEGTDEPEVLFEEALYHASAPTLASHLRKVEAGKHHVMVIGHNPGIHALALMLTGSGAPEARAALAHKFPTAALAVISFEVNAWRAICTGGGYLKRYVTPSQVREKD